jgi:hypothetical protein
MNEEIKKSEQQSCGKESCACSEKPSSKIPQEKSAEVVKLEPTRFGDWEVNGRAIDF